MSDQQAPPPQQTMTPPPALADVLGALLRATHTAATKSAGSTDAREVREFGQAALGFAQAAVALDPALIAPQGVPPEVMAAATAQRPDTAGQDQPGAGAPQ